LPPAHPRSLGGNGSQTFSSPPQMTPLPSYDPNTMVHQLEAWMPEKIASYKLRGFVQDSGGEVLECVPGRIRVRLGGRGSVYAPPGNGSISSWLGLTKRSSLIELELHLQRADPARDSQLRITVMLRPVNGTTSDPEWRTRCGQIYCDLRAYLMGQS
jgi:serine/threonine-protein kinase